MDSNRILSRITDKDIIKLMNHFGSDVSNKSNGRQIIFSTCVCHGGDGYKLYYYTETKSFHCFSSCGTFKDVFDLVKHIKNCSFNESVTFIKEFFNFNKYTPKKGFSKKREVVYEKKSLKDIEITNLPIIDKPYIHNTFLNVPIKAWEDDGISYEAMKSFQIRYDRNNNCAIIPHFNHKGETVGVRCRNFDDKLIRAYGKYYPFYCNSVGYAHSLGNNVYGLHKTKYAIRKHKKVVIFESEKSVLQMETLFKDNNIAVAVCGSNLSLIQIKQILNIVSVKEFIFAFDKEYSNEEEETVYLNKIKKLAYPIIQEGIKVSVIWDEIDGLLGLKDSPTDKGIEVYLKLVKNRRCIK